MTRTKKQLKALDALNLDLFHSESLAPPAPATIHTRIREYANRQTLPDPPPREVVNPPGSLPSIAELYRRFEVFNWMYFQGKLPRPVIQYSSRMNSAGSYTPHGRIIKIGRKYHELFPQDIDDTLKHEMIHIIHFYHDAAFRREARRIGASMRARSHPALTRPPKYLYQCPGCQRTFPRQKLLRQSSCGYCSDGGKFDPRYKLCLIESRASKKTAARKADRR
jgi:predicted SprT family Zn-dependent metalloprotease